MTPLATLVEHARFSDTERAICRIIAEKGHMGGTARELADTLCVNRSSLFRALASLDHAGVIMRSAKRGKAGSMLVTFNGRAVDKLRALCDHLGGRDEHTGAEYTAIPPEMEETVRADRARLLAEKRRRVSAALGNAFARDGGEG